MKAYGHLSSLSARTELICIASLEYVQLEQPTAKGVNLQAYHAMANLREKRKKNVTRKIPLRICDSCFAQNWQL